MFSRKNAFSQLYFDIIPRLMIAKLGHRPGSCGTTVSGPWFAAVTSIEADLGRFNVKDLPTEKIGIGY